MTKYQFIIQIIVTNQALGNALAVALGGAGDAHTFSDEYALRLTKDGLPSWGSEVVVTQAEYDTACNFRDGVNPPELGLSDAQFNAARAVSTVRCEDRSVQYRLREWAESLGFSVAPD